MPNKQYVAYAGPIFLTKQLQALARRLVFPGTSTPSTSNNHLWITYSSYKVAHGPEITSSWPWFALEPFPRGHQTNTQSDQLQTSPETQEPINHFPNRKTQQAQSPAKTNPAPWGQLLCSSFLIVVMASLSTNHPEGQSLSLMCQQQSRLTYNRRAHTTHTWDTPGAPSSGEQGDYVTEAHRTPTP